MDEKKSIVLRYLSYDLFLIQQKHAIETSKTHKFFQLGERKKGKRLVLRDNNILSIILCHQNIIHIYSNRIKMFTTFATDKKEMLERENAGERKKTPGSPNQKIWNRKLWSSSNSVVTLARVELSAATWHQ